MFCLYLCADGIFVVVPAGMYPPIDIVRRHGDAVLVSDKPLRLYDSPLWEDVSRRMEPDLHVEVEARTALGLFET